MREPVYIYIHTTHQHTVKPALSTTCGDSLKVSSIERWSFQIGGTTGA